MAMIELSEETEALARRLADVQRMSIDAVVKRALETAAHAAGATPQPARLRDRAAEITARRHAGMDRVVHEIAALPVLDPRSPREIMDDLNAA